MNPFLSLTLGMALLLPLTLRAETPDPLRFYPVAHTDVIVKIEKPRLLVESLLNHPQFKEAQNLAVVRESLDSANIRKLLKLLTYYERELGAPWPELLDQLAGGGIALGFKIVPDQQEAPTLFVFQGKDEKQTKRLTELVLRLVNDEMAREGNQKGIEKKTYGGVDCYQFDKEFFVAPIGSAILAANREAALKAGIDQHNANLKNPNETNVSTSLAPKQTQGLLPKNPLAWLWLNLKPLKANPMIKDNLVTPRNDVFQTLILAGIYDVVRRSEYFVGGLYQENGNFKLTFRLPAGREEMAVDAELHHPRDPKMGGTLPPLEPKGVLFCHSFYLDLDVLYKKREQIMPEMIAKSFVEGEKQASRFLIGSSIPQYFSQSGQYHRFVAAQPERVEGYTTEPTERLPSFAFVTRMRHPDFAKTTNSVIKAAGFGAGKQFGLRSWEEEIAGVPAFGYSFSDKVKSTDDPQNSRFNYQPAFATVGSYYIAASNKGLCRELIEILRKEELSQAMSPNVQTRFYANGFASFIDSRPNDTLVDTILAQNVPLPLAKEQAKTLVNFIRKLGSLELKTDYLDREFHFDLDVTLQK